MRSRKNNTRGRNRSRNVKSYCAYCSKEILGKISSVKWCGDACRTLWRYKNEKGYKENQEKRTVDRRIKLMRIVIGEYGGECNCCGESNEKFLTIDHVNNDGKLEKTSSGKSRVNGSQLYSKIIKNKFPVNYQVLCMNCNWGKARNKGICPHKLNLTTHQETGQEDSTNQ